MKDTAGPVNPKFLSSHDSETAVMREDLLSEENMNLQKQLAELESSYNKSQETIEILENRLAKAEANALKAFKEKSDDKLVFKIL